MATVPPAIPTTWPPASTVAIAGFALPQVPPIVPSVRVSVPVGQIVPAPDMDAGEPFTVTTVVTLPHVVA